MHDSIKGVARCVYQIPSSVDCLTPRWMVESVLLKAGDYVTLTEVVGKGQCQAICVE